MKKMIMSGLLALICASVGAEESNTVASFFNLTLTGPDDKPVLLESFKGKPLLINFWAPWCGPCRNEIPDLAETESKYKSKGLEILGLAIEDTGRRENVQEFAKSHGLNYLVFMAGMANGVELMQRFGNTKGGLPFTVVNDRSGRVVGSKLGAMNRTEMSAVIEPIL